MSEEQNIANTSNSGSERTEQNIEVKSSNSNSDSKMSYFNLETSLKVIPEFTENYKELPAFLKIIEFIEC